MNVPKIFQLLNSLKKGEVPYSSQETVKINSKNFSLADSKEHIGTLLLSEVLETKSFSREPYSYIFSLLTYFCIKVITIGKSLWKKARDATNEKKILKISSVGRFS